MWSLKCQSLESSDTLAPLFKTSQDFQQLPVKTPLFKMVVTYSQLSLTLTDCEVVGRISKIIYCGKQSWKSLEKLGE